MKRSRLIDKRKKLVLTRGKGEEQGRGREREAPTTGCKTGSRMTSPTQEIQPVFCNNCKWKVIFKMVK